MKPNTFILEDWLLDNLQQRIDTVFDELSEKYDLLRNSELYDLDPDKYQQVDIEATRLDGRLEELNFFKKLLTEGK